MAEYRAASIIAGLIVLLAIANTIDNLSEGEPIIPIVALALAGLVWLIGWLCRSIFGRSEALSEERKLEWPFQHHMELGLED